MENSIIDCILYSDSEFFDKVVQDAEYQKASKDGLKAYEKFKEALSEKQKEEFDNFVDLLTDEKRICNDNYFKLGVKVGLRLAAECISL